jgi:CRP/FNR family transcriptional regulator, cyclic AMP receptor protein
LLPSVPPGPWLREFSPSGGASPHAELTFLPDLHEDDWATLIRHTERRRFRRGDVIVSAGEVDRSLWIVVQGSLDLFLPDVRGSFLRFGPHSIVGEMAFLDDRPRSATIRARTDGELLRLTFAAFEVLAARHPALGRRVLLDLGRILAIRLERTNHELARHPR